MLSTLLHRITQTRGTVRNPIHVLHGMRLAGEKPAKKIELGGTRPDASRPD